VTLTLALLKTTQQNSQTGQVTLAFITVSLCVFRSEWIFCDCGFTVVSIIKKFTMALTRNISCKRIDTSIVFFLCNVYRNLEGWNNGFGKVWRRRRRESSLLEYMLLLPFPSSFKRY
jgi:hypothetical protein